MINVIEGNSISRVNIDSKDIVLWIERKFADEVFATRESAAKLNTAVEGVDYHVFAD